MKVLTRTSKMSIIRRMKYYKLLVFVGIRFTSFTPISTNNAAPRVYVEEIGKSKNGLQTTYQ